MKIITGGCALVLALSMSPVQAINQEIRALFQPDSSQPGKNVFVNQTPNSGYCATFPDQCAENSMFSIQVPVRFNSTLTLPPNWGVGIRVPANWRRLTVTNTDTMETEIVEVRITGVGSNYVLSQPAHELVGVSDPLVGHQRLWEGSSWVYAPPPCRYSGVGVFSPASYRFFWKTPVEDYCVKKTLATIPSMYFDTLDFAYELRTPNPLGMSSGLYTGSLNYSLGNGGDFHFGQSFQPDDNNLTLDFVLDVQHTLKVDLPPGGNKVSLEPEGGWAPWIESGRKPSRIFRDQPFFISASSRFKVMLLCGSLGGPYCYLTSPLGDSVPVKVSMSLPAGIDGPGGPGAPVNRIPLQFNTWRGPFQPSMYVERKAGALHFELEPRDIDFLLRPGKNDRLRGNITIIWDSDA
ncbi:hypothetical protein H8F23_04230 [Pseudomonas sp. P155]|uniref:Uncharacterized protein n=1 Tax=Pseudomonas neuropathica TaxID=2730425 RepID=A0ABS0BD99_9PSED|nr:hypothetical protein [Pseudomonas neuropathica]MBF6032452.1 hypothetical protein [Pseudomonas neuropathica]